ncbi:MAG: phosphoribosylglycinamide formyltransferase [Pseudomonadota bacterium]
MKVAVFISGRGSNLQALIRAAQNPGYGAQICLVLSDKADAGGLTLARTANIAARAISRADHPTKSAFEAALTDAAEAHGADLICLAGFMRILSAEFVTRWRGRILNIHPSLLPGLRGLDTHARALAAGVKIHGATVHLVTESLDDGPILAQAALAVAPDDTAESLAARVLTLEHLLYPRALKQFIERGFSPSAFTSNQTLFNPPAEAED